MLHSMLPGLTHDNGEMESHHQLFPFGDDEKFRSESLASFYIDAFSVYAQLWPDSALGRYARQAMDFLGVRPKRYFEGAQGEANDALSWHSLPPDYFAAGSGHFFARSAWPQSEDHNVMVMHFQGGQVENIGHYHADAMNLQLWRGNPRDGGWFLTRETTAYGDCLGGFGNRRRNGEDTLFHNGVSFADGRGQLRWHGNGGPRLVHTTSNKYDRSDLPDGLPVVERLASHDRLAYIAADYTRSYRAANGENPPRYDLLPFVEEVRREVIFARDLEAVIVVDRLDVSDWEKPLENGETEPVPALDIPKIVSWHFGVIPQLDETSGRAAATYETEDSRQHFVIHTLTGAAFKLVNETVWPKPGAGESWGCDLQEPNVGQWRLEVLPESDADGRSLVITVLHGADSEAAASELDISLADEGDALKVTLEHASRGKAEVVIGKRWEDPGSFRWWEPGNNGTADETVELRDFRDYMYVGAEGPAWAGEQDGAVESSERALVGGYDDSGVLVLEQRIPESTLTSTTYRVPQDVARHRLLRLRRGNYAIEAQLANGEYEVTVTRGTAGTIHVGKDFVIEFVLDGTTVNVLHPLP
ncbi:MAG TPA: hypothetical protein VKZ99_10185 [Gammaproteobacteria bacterium]|nr:hypothetical protein [Gammaproteobacteria bacterium]